MTKPVIVIDESVFLKDFATFEKFLLPVLNKQRTESGFSPLTGSEAIDRYLDLYNEFMRDNGANAKADPTAAG
jgi:hypothetical protein